MSAFPRVDPMMSYFFIQPLFPTGRILISPAAEALGINLHRYIRRHCSGDWGDLLPEDLEENQKALAAGESILSQYELTDTDGEVHRLVVMTESNRIYTVLHLDGEPLGEHGGN